MRAVSYFGLEKHSGAYATWPLRTALLHHGQRTGVKVPGFEILHQFERNNGEYLLVLDWDCPFEEATEVLLLSPGFRILSRKTYGGPYSSWLLHKFISITDESFYLDFRENEILRRIQIEPKKWWNRTRRFRTTIVKRAFSEADIERNPK